MVTALDLELVNGTTLCALEVIFNTLKTALFQNFLLNF